jgi:hypothetical protein
VIRSAAHGSGSRRRAKVDRVTLAPHPARHLVAAEALLRLDRPEHALVRLNRIRQLPADLLEQVPALQGRRFDPAFQSTFTRIGQR